MQKEIKKLWLGDKPKKCDVCEKPIGDSFADAVIPAMGVWGIICPECCTEFNVQFSTGRGQMYREEAGRFIKIQG